MGATLRLADAREMQADELMGDHGPEGGGLYRRDEFRR
jgi:hypothetical protein